MTDKERQNQKMSVGQRLFCLVSALALALTFIYSDVAISSMSDGMRLCVSTLIPSLFPFMVISELFVRSGMASVVGRALGAPISKLFGISREGSVAWLLGVACGFPIGIKCALSLYERGKISRGELEHLSTFCNTPSSAFLIGAVGASLFGSRQFGLILYVSHLLSSVIIGFATRFYFERRKREIFEPSPDAFGPTKRGVSAFADSVTSSATSMLFICAFVVFFSSFAGILRHILDGVRIADRAKALIFGLFEMTGGVSAAAELPLRYAIPIAGAITGWSGLSVHFQLIGICGERKISFLPYFLAKIASAMLCAAFTGVLAGIFADTLCFSVGGSIQSFLFIRAKPIVVLTLGLFAISCLRLVSREKRK